MVTIMKITQWFKRNWLPVILSILLIGVLTFHYFGTYNPPIVQPAMVINPKTETKELVNGQIADIKASMSQTNSPQMAGFSEAYIKDTIGKILGVKQKEILAINRVTGSYVDSLQYVKEELDEQKRLTKFYQSKDSKGNVVGNGKVTDGGPMVYQGNTSITSVLKKGEFDKRGHRLTPDSLVFYDPNQKFKINESWEYSVIVPEKTKKQKITISAQAGVGVVAPKFDIKQSAPGYYIGAGLSYNF